MIYKEETTRDEWGSYTTRWHCKPPPKDSNYIVVQQHWDDDETQDIFEIKLIKEDWK
jgi:hypothetical protein